MRIKRPFFFALGMVMCVIFGVNIIKGSDIFIIGVNIIAIISNFIASFDG